MSFSRSERKVTHRITPVKVKTERRNTVEIENTVKTTLNSAWTPNKPGVLNTQLFEERKCLIGHWFEDWTDSQRRQFLEHLVAKFNKMSVYFVHDKIKDQIEAPPTDFTTLFPREISFKILGYLDPRSLAQASLVSWNWKYLCEHDKIWKPKCKKRGWDYGMPEPPYERAVWKRFYQKQVWDLLHPPTPPSLNDTDYLDVTEEDGVLFGSGGSGGKKKTKPCRPKAYKLGDATPLNIGYMKHKQQELPPWRSSDSKPKDIQLFNKQILGINSENIPKHISDKFTKVEIHRGPASPRGSTSPLPRTRSMETARRSKDRNTPSPIPLQSKSMVRERTSPSNGILKSSSSFEDRTPIGRRSSNPALSAKRAQQTGPVTRKLGAGIADNRTIRTPGQTRKKPTTFKSSDSGEAIHIPASWGTPDKRYTAKKVASTDTLGSDAALDHESNESLSIYGDDSGKLSGEAWELHSNISDN